MEKQEFVNFEFSLGKSEDVKTLLSSMIDESNTQSEDWKPVFGAEIYEMKTGKVFDNVLGQIKAPFENAFKDMSHSEDSGKAFDEIVEKGSAIDKIFNFVELRGRHGETIVLDGYHGVDYRNWDGNRRDIPITDEIVLRGVLPKEGLEKVFDIMKNNSFFKKYAPHSFDNEISKEAMRMYNESLNKTMIHKSSLALPKNKRNQSVQNSNDISLEQ